MLTFRSLLRPLIATALTLVSLLSTSAATPEKHTSAINHFTWGAEAGGTIDLTGNDLSAFTLDAFFGYRNSTIDMLGIGVGIQSMVNQSKRSFPIYALLRSNFSSTPTVCFLSLKTGIILNDFTTSQPRGAFMIAPALGFNLAKGKSFQSYLTIGYLFNSYHTHPSRTTLPHIDGIHMATISLGIAF